MKKTVKIEIDGNKYTLTVNRKIVETLYNIDPDVLKILDPSRMNKDEQGSIIDRTSIKLTSNLDKLFYQMISIAHPNISKEKSDAILEKFDEEYEDVAGELTKLVFSVFIEGDQKKKKINW